MIMIEVKVYVKNFVSKQVRNGEVITCHSLTINGTAMCNSGNQDHQVLIFYLADHIDL
ncbi:hypothetical protein MNBD_GAMMA16-2060 [hydrothermal vent metagenome]|uniref:Uncharacterized protein n=1 Tax=hydrothermal vent metagenome TaxID=652676 RepID=A0A3B0YRX0_9ZZZZ